VHNLDGIEDTVNGLSGLAQLKIQREHSIFESNAIADRSSNTKNVLLLGPSDFSRGRVGQSVICNCWKWRNIYYPF